MQNETQAIDKNIPNSGLEVVIELKKLVTGGQIRYISETAIIKPKNPPKMLFIFID
jgi:hypothetical protein